MLSIRRLPRGYNALNAYLNGETNRPLANNTTVLKYGNNIVVRLHSTDIVTFYPNGAIALNSGNWRTVTTKQRMNAVLPYNLHVHQRNHQWYVWRNGEEEVAFRDGMILQGELVPTETTNV